MRVGVATLAMALGVLIVACTNAADSRPPSDNAPQPDPGRAIDIQGHRGARGLTPESTLPSFETALDLGVTTLEFDLHFTSDDEIVIWHDPVISPDKCGLTSGAPDSIPNPDDHGTTADELAVRSLSVAQIRWFDCSRNPDPGRFPDQNPVATALAGDAYGVVTLSVLLDFVDMYSRSDGKTDAQRSGARMVRFNIETKRDPTEPATIGDGFDGVNAGAFELRLLAVIEAHAIGDRVVIQSFDERSLMAIRQASPSIELALLTSFGSPQFAAVSADGTTVWSPRSSTLTEALISEAHASGLSVATWTVNSEADMRELVAIGVDAIITDRPDIALDVLNQG